MTAYESLDLPSDEIYALYEQGICLLTAANPTEREDWDELPLAILGLYKKFMADYIAAEDIQSAIFYLQESLSAADLACSKAGSDSLRRVEEAAELKASLVKSALLSDTRREDFKEFFPDGVLRDY
ncbi:hypothetical protein CSPAE12_06972 [Colletotrichum incanum]|nr:hypothetical protein CSPAE12_06972 [Colletotrichum incanum]